MRLRTFLILFFCLAIGSTVCSEAHAAIYKYVDKNGMIYFADDLQSIPAQYRPAAKIVSGEDTGVSKDQTSQTSPNAQTETAESETVFSRTKKLSTEKQDGNSFFRRATTTIIIVVSALFVFVILRMLDAEHKKIVSITRVVILWGVSIYIIFAHTVDVVNAFSSIGKKIDGTQQQSEERGRKASKVMKQLDSFIDQVEKGSVPDQGDGAQEKYE
jgi:hypothetical protein